MYICEQVSTGVTHEELVAEIHKSGTRMNNDDGSIPFAALL